MPEQHDDARVIRTLEFLEKQNHPQSPDTIQFFVNTTGQEKVHDENRGGFFSMLREVPGIEEQDGGFVLKKGD